MDEPGVVGARVCSVARIAVHPAFDPDTFVNDIAVLTLSTNAPATLAPIRLSDSAANEATGTSVVVSTCWCTLFAGMRCH